MRLPRSLLPRGECQQSTVPVAMTLRAGLAGLMIMVAVLLGGQFSAVLDGRAPLLVIREGAACIFPVLSYYIPNILK